MNDESADTINAGPYDSLLVVSFGGPEGRADVLPFLENVLRGRDVPRERMLEVAEHYYQFNGVSPLNEQNRALIQALEMELAAHGPQLSVYWGNRNWHPMLSDTIEQMQNDGMQRSLAFITSAYSSYSGCRQYRENIAEAQRAVGRGAPAIDKLRAFFNHPDFIRAMTEQVQTAIAALPSQKQSGPKVLFTAHSLPSVMARGCDYVQQLTESCRLVSEALQLPDYQLVYQSRSGPPHQPWLSPDICDAIRKSHAEENVRNLVIAPIGFLSDHMEVLYDLDLEARQLCRELDINMARARTVGTHPAFVEMIRKLILERTAGTVREALGSLGPRSDECLSDCCPAPTRAQPRNG